MCCFVLQPPFQVEQANIIAKDLGKNMEFEVKMFKNRLTNENDVAVMASSNRGQRVWPWEKFEVCQAGVGHAIMWSVPRGGHTSSDPALLTEARTACPRRQRHVVGLGPGTRYRGRENYGRG